MPQFPGPSPIWLTLLTSMFMHGGWLHLIGNMWFLWIFGDNIEDELGHWRYLAFYLVTGVLASLAHVFLSFGQNRYIPSLGASGAISGVLGAYLVMYPTALVRVLIPPFFILPLPAVVVLGIVLIIAGTLYTFYDVVNPGGSPAWASAGGDFSGVASALGGLGETVAQTAAPAVATSDPLEAIERQVRATGNDPEALTTAAVNAIRTLLIGDEAGTDQAREQALVDGGAVPAQQAEPGRGRFGGGRPLDPHAAALVRERNDRAFSDVNYIIPAFVLAELPIGLAGLFIAGVIAASMSSIAAVLNALATTSVIDF